MPPLAKNHSALDPSVWGPHFWFFLHTISLTYPVYPNAVTKKKYYDFVQNIPLFIPVEGMAGDFSKLLDEYPVQPYLDKRESFVTWMWFIHNKINQKLEKPSISLSQFYTTYYEQYKPVGEKLNDYRKLKSRVIYFSLLSFSVFVSYYIYQKS